MKPPHSSSRGYDCDRSCCFSRSGGTVCQLFYCAGLPALCAFHADSRYAVERSALRDRNAASDALARAQALDGFVCLHAPGPLVVPGRHASAFYFAARQVVLRRRSGRRRVRRLGHRRHLGQKMGPSLFRSRSLSALRALRKKSKISSCKRANVVSDATLGGAGAFVGTGTGPLVLLSPGRVVVCAGVALFSRVSVSDQDRVGRRLAAAHHLHDKAFGFVQVHIP